VSIVNLEVALTDGDTHIKKIGPALRAPVGTAATLAKLGVTYCSLANNHVFDHGKPGAESTVKALEAADIGYTGFGENIAGSRRNLILDDGNERVCVISVCEHEYSYALEDRMGTRAFDEFETPFEIREAKAKYDRVIVLYHGGKEQCEYPSPRLRKACRAMVRAGAGLVVCQHSHCVGCREEYRGGEIVYGQGNFNFVKYIDHPHWQSGLMLDVRAENGLHVEYIPVIAGDNGIDLAQGEEKQAVLEGFFSRSEMIMNGTLALTLTRAEADDSFIVKEWDVNGKKAVIAIRKHA